MDEEGLRPDGSGQGPDEGPGDGSGAEPAAVPDQSQPGQPKPVPSAPDQQQQQRYRSSSVASWSCLSALLLFPVGFGLFVLAALLPSWLLGPDTEAPPWALLAASLLPGLLLPVALWRMSGSATASSRSMWAGIAIGSGIFLVIFAGTCGQLVVGNTGWT